MTEIVREPNPVFIDKTPEELSWVYVTKMNKFLASLGEEGKELQLAPELTASIFIPALQRVIAGTLKSGFQPIFWNLLEVTLKLMKNGISLIWLISSNEIKTAAVDQSRQYFWEACSFQVFPYLCRLPIFSVNS